MSRFDYIRYDEQSAAKQLEAKETVVAVEKIIDSIGHNFQTDVCDRAKENAIKALEECYMWIGKGIRDEQRIRDAGRTQLEEGRSAS